MIFIILPGYFIVIFIILPGIYHCDFHNIGWIYHCNFIIMPGIYYNFTLVYITVLFQIVWRSRVMGPLMTPKFVCCHRSICNIGHQSQTTTNHISFENFLKMPI